MESVFFIVLREWGPAAVSILLIFVVSFLIKEIKKNSEDEKHRMSKLHNDITKMREDVNDSLNSFGARLTAVEKDYVDKEFFFRELQGWRSEINRVSDQITNCFSSLTQNIFQLLSGGKK